WAQGLLYLPISVLVAGVLYSLQATQLRVVIIVLFGLVNPAVGVLAQAYRWIYPRTGEERQLSRLLFFALLQAVSAALLVNPARLRSPFSRCATGCNAWRTDSFMEIGRPPTRSSPRSPGSPSRLPRRTSCRGPPRSCPRVRVRPRSCG